MTDDLRNLLAAGAVVTLLLAPLSGCAAKRPPGVQGTPASVESIAAEYGRAGAMAGVAHEWVMAETRRTYAREMEAIKQELLRRSVRGGRGGSRVSYCDLTGCEPE